MPSSTESPEGVVARLMREGGWWFEPKLDGIRALVSVLDGVVVITNRTGRDITYRYPDVEAKTTGLPDMVLDGEIVCTVHGVPDFHRIQQRDAQTSPGKALTLARSLPATFAVFDILTRHNVDLRALSYELRRTQLTELAARLTAHSVVLVPSEQDGAVMLQAMAALNMEGVVAKRRDHRYVGRRSEAWVKVKRTRRISALVSGYDPGEGHRARTFGALHLSLLDAAGELVRVGSVGSGFRESDIVAIWGRLQRDEHPIIVEVAYLGVNQSGTIRQPVFKGIRSDVEAAECQMTQLKRSTGVSG